MTLLTFLFSFLFLTPQNENKDSVIIIRKIEVQGNYKTKEKIILREISVHQGDTLTGKTTVLLERNRQNIFNLNLFVTVNVLLKNQQNNEVDLVIEVKERWYYIILPTFSLADRNFSDWWYNHNHDFSRTIYGVYASYTNLTGNNDKLRLIAETGFIPNFSLSYISPYLDKKQTMNATIGISYALNRTLAYRTFEDKSEFIISEAKQRQRWVASLGINRRIGLYKFHSFGLSYADTKIADTIAKANPAYLLNNTTRQKYFLATYSYTYDKRDSKQYALKGERYSFTAAKYGLFSNEGINQWAIFGNYANNFPLGNRFYSNFSIRGKISFPDKQPYLQTAGLGYGGDYVRGYELYVIDGQAYGLVKTNLKYQLINKTFDLKKMLKIQQFNTFPIAVYLNSFFDAGYSKNTYAEQITSKLANKIILGGGIGLDIVSWYNYVGKINYAFNQMGEGRIYFSALREF